MITEALLNEWKRQAKRDGNLDEYEYHLGMFNNPLPYIRWRIKYNKVKRIQSRSDYSDLSNDSDVMKAETILCNELGL